MNTKTRSCIPALLAGALLGGSMLEGGCARRVVYVQEPPPAAGETVVVAEAPPEPPVEVIGVAPGPENVWVTGFWEWHGRWVWVPGRWVVRPRPRAVWVGSHWVHRPHGWVMVHGHWR
jgi:hypothetical protein